MSQVDGKQLKAGTVTNAKLANMANATVRGRNAAGTGVPEDVTMAQLRVLLGLPYAKSTTNSTTNSTSEANLANVLIPANTLTSGNILIINPRYTKTGTTSGWTLRIRIHTSNALAGNLISSIGATSSFQFGQLEKIGFIKSATDTQFGATGLINDNSFLTGTALATYNIDWTVDQYIIFSAFVTSAADTAILSGYKLLIH